ncbi:hypothetical protein HanRHA438_Chr01g0011861 [Helianthus annuus]|nr:hypothetical protein HanRHA438_Chr01g0011861 [Helianthus annuus]
MFEGLHQLLYDLLGLEQLGILSEIQFKFGTSCHTLQYWCSSLHYCFLKVGTHFTDELNRVFIWWIVDVDCDHGVLNFASKRFLGFLILRVEVEGGLLCRLQDVFIVFLRQRSWSIYRGWLVFKVVNDTLMML